MELAQLAAYAAKQHHMDEEHLWKDFPGFSVLRHPRSGKWVALLMRQWDEESGTERQWCDIKCGGRTREEQALPYLQAPFRMKGPKWVGVTLETAAASVVEALLDRAVRSGEEHGYTVVLEEGAAAGRRIPKTGELAGALAGQGSGIYKGVYDLLKARQEELNRQKKQASAQRGQTRTSYGQSYSFGWESRPTRPENASGRYHDTPLPERGASRADESYASALPEKLRDMRRLYDYRTSTEDRRQAFLRQARFMEDYEDAALWEGVLHLYMPVYQDLNTRQLRGYFTWRAQVRRGQYLAAPDAFLRIYAAELINGVGAATDVEALAALQKLLSGMPEGALGASLRRDIRQWMADLAVVKGIPADVAAPYLDGPTAAREADLSVLREPASQTDERLWEAIGRFEGKKLSASPVVTDHREEGSRLFAAVWRQAAEGGAFVRCFGELRPVLWRPFAGTFYTDDGGDRTYTVSPCRYYEKASGRWREYRYDPLAFDGKAFSALFHEADRQLRRYLKTGRYLKEKPEEAWASPFAAAAIAADQKAREEAARPVITIDLSGLEKIRQDAAVTRESLLTEEDLGVEALPAFGDIPKAPEPAAGELLVEETPSQPAAPTPPSAPPSVFAPPPASLLAPLPAEALRLLLAGAPLQPFIAEHHLFPEVLADDINEALFGELGDSAVECDGQEIVIVEDYREDIARIVEGEFS